MRMRHYYLALSVPAAGLLVATLVSGLAGGGQRHLGLGLFTSILCVAAHTLLILFMIVTGRVLREAARSRELPRAFLDELNVFFARKSAYPLALGAAAATAATAVLGYGRNIGVPLAVHLACGVAIVVLNPLAFRHGARALRANQALVDRAARALDELDRQGAPIRQPEPTEETSPGRSRRRALAFAASAWLPALYWGLIVWRGHFERLSPALWLVSALASAAGLAAAFTRRDGATRAER